MAAAKQQPAQLRDQQQKQLEGAPKAYWAVMSTGDPLQPIPCVLESMEEALALMSDSAPFRLRVGGCGLE
jgi:hypothetical protein